jgi:HPt (histidine-containing phosphotransfer) domain-containing protein
MPDDKKNIVDLEYVTELSRGNKDFIREIITIFLDENPREIQILEKAVDDNDYDLVKSTAHKLKSTIPFLGLDKVVGQDVFEIENLASQRTNMSAIKEHLNKVKLACDKAYAELDPILKGL